MGSVCVGPGITSFLIPRYSLQDITLCQTDLLSNLCLYTNALGVAECSSISSGCLSGAGMTFVCILRTEQAAYGMRGFSLSFASLQHILLFFLFLFFFPTALINYFLMCWFLPEKHWEGLGFFWGFWQRGVWKRLKSGLRNVYLRKIWLTEFLWAGTLLL